MSKKKKNLDRDQLVYTTKEEGNPFFNNLLIGDDDSNEESSSNKNMRIRVTRDRKKRGGKEVTLVMGLELSDDSLQELTKKLKQKCGVGGSAKDGEIIIQGNKVEKVIELLKKEGYSDVKRTGG